MVILIIVLLTIVGIFTIGFYAFNGITLFTIKKLVPKCKSELDYITHDVVSVKPIDFMLWNKNDFNDYTTLWYFVDNNKRIKEEITISFNKLGEITNMSPEEMDKLLPFVSVKKGEIIMSKKD